MSITTGVKSTLVDAVAHHPGVAAVGTVGRYVSQIGELGVPVFTVIEPDAGAAVQLVTLSGRAPRSDDEIVLGPSTARDLGVNSGDTVSLADGGSAKVVGLGLFPSDVHAQFDEGAWVSPTRWSRLAELTYDPESATTEMLVAVRFADRGDLSTQIGALATAFGSTVSAVIPVDQPLELANLHNVRTLPTVLAIFLAVLGAVAVGHALFSSVYRRRRDFAVMQSLGITRSGVRAMIAAQATVVGIAGLVGRCADRSDRRSCRLASHHRAGAADVPLTADCHRHRPRRAGRVDRREPAGDHPRSPSLQDEACNGVEVGVGRHESGPVPDAQRAAQSLVGDGDRDTDRRGRVLGRHRVRRGRSAHIDSAGSLHLELRWGVRRPRPTGRRCTPEGCRDRRVAGGVVGRPDDVCLRRSRRRQRRRRSTPPTVFIGSFRPAGVRLVEGREADPHNPNEFVATRSFVEQTHAKLGDSFDLVTLTPEQARDFGFAMDDPQGPRVPVVLVGVVDGAAQLEDPFPFAVVSPALLDGYEIGVADT